MKTILQGVRVDAIKLISIFHCLPLYKYIIILFQSLRTYYCNTSTNYVYLKFSEYEYELKDSLCRHICISYMLYSYNIILQHLVALHRSDFMFCCYAYRRYKGKILCRYVYDLSQYQISNSCLQWFISYRYQTEVKENVLKAVVFSFYIFGKS